MDQQLHLLRPLVMEDIPAQGLTPNKRQRSTAQHRVGLAYASAVPVAAYMNQGAALQDAREASNPWFSTCFPDGKARSRCKPHRKSSRGVAISIPNGLKVLSKTT